MSDRPETPPPAFSLECDAHGSLVFTDAQGRRTAGCVPVRSFPIAAPDEGISLIGPEGRELAWIDHLDGLDSASRSLVETDLRQREFSPEILRIRKVSTYATPSVWDIETDRGETRLTLHGEEDIRRLPGRGLLIADARGVQFKVSDLQALDRGSRRILERFL